MKGAVDWRALAAQFRDLDPNDPGRWPVLPQVVVIAVAMALALAGAHYSFWSDQVAQIEAAAKKEEELKQQWLAKKRQAVHLPLYQAQVEEGERLFGALLRQLPSKAEMDGLLREAHQLGLRRQLAFDLFRPGNEVKKEFYAELPVTLVVAGPYQALAGFVSDASTMPRVVSIGDFTLAAQEAKTGGGLRLEATLFAYRYLEDEERAASAAAPAAPKRR